MYANRDVVILVRFWNCFLKRISATKCLLCDIKRRFRILKENKLGFLSVPHSHRHVLWSSHRTHDIHNCCETLSYTNVKTCSINQDLLQQGFEHPTFSMQNDIFCSLHYFGKIQRFVPVDWLLIISDVHACTKPVGKYFLRDHVFLQPV